MWVSMTGFGRGDRHGEDVMVTAEIRSVNHRFLDIHVRCPARYLLWEQRIRSMARRVLRRGKVDVFLNIREWGRTGNAVRVNHGLLSSFLVEANRIREEYSLPMELSFSDLVRVPDIFVFGPEGSDPAEEHWDLGEGAVQDALSMLVSSRREEGGRLRDVIMQAVRKIQALSAEISGLSAENKELVQARFRERIEALSGEAGVDPARVQQEAAFLIDRIDITEECDRLSSHLSGMEGLMAIAGEAVGKRFDFLVQEAFRELNTASSKSAHAGISERVVEGKTELEKIREQIQNVE
jgi:uncharacterized protein (TIGR00255 family)